MNTAMTTIRSFLPAPVRHRLRTYHRDWVFRRAMSVFLADPLATTHPGSPILPQLIYGWGNDGWPALPEYLVTAIRHALMPGGPILECGSGLTTMLIGAAAQRSGRRLWSLEHLPAWGERVGDYLARHGVDGVHLCVSPLRDYGHFAWYDPPLAAMPDDFALVICDGPPGSTWGGRYGLLPVMGKKLTADCIILLDDGGRPEEQAIARRWQAESGGSCEILGRQKPYIRLSLRKSP